MQKHVFLITENVVLDSGLCSFEYRPDLFKEYLDLNTISTPIALSDQDIPKTIPLQYDKVITTLFFDSNFKKAQVIDISLDHIKLTKYKKENNEIDITSVKKLIKEGDLINSILRFTPNNNQHINTLMNFISERRTFDTGSPELNAFIILGVLWLSKKDIDFGNPIILLSDFTLSESIQNLFEKLYTNLEIKIDIKIYNKPNVYLKSHSLIDYLEPPINSKFVEVAQNKKGVAATIQLGVKDQRYSIENNEVRIFSIKENDLIRIYNPHDKVIFKDNTKGFFVISTC